MQPQTHGKLIKSKIRRQPARPGRGSEKDQVQEVNALVKSRVPRVSGTYHVTIPTIGSRVTLGERYAFASYPPDLSLVAI